MRKDFDQYVEEKIENKKNRKLILEFISYSLATGKTKRRIIRYLDALVPLSNTIGKPFKKMKKRDMEGYIRNLIGREDYADWTKYSYQIIIKNCFFPWLYGTEKPDYPKVVKWMRPKNPKRNNKLPEDMINEEEAKRMIDAADNNRDKAFVSFLFESGARIGEIMNMRIKDVQFNGGVTHVTLDGKTGMRRIPVINSGIYLSDWINNHPEKNNPESKIFYNKLSGDFAEKTTYWQVRWLLLKTARKAKVTKKVNPHNFRHSQATLLAGKLTEQLLKMYFGWSGDSRMAATYVHMSSEQLTDAVVEARGIENGKNLSIETIREIIREEISGVLRKC